MLGSDGRREEVHDEGGEERASYGPGPEEQLVSQDDWLIKGGNVTEDSFWEWERGLCDK